jgi:AraC-like DNA-binding protein
VASIQRAASPLLRPFLRTLWISEEDRGSATAGEQREHVLPTGAVHVVFRLSGPALRLYDGPDDRAGRVIGRAIVGGARAGYYVRDVAEPVWSVGAELLPGAAPLLLGVPAGELAERHTRLEDLWGPAVREIEERLALAGSAERQLALFESVLASRLPRVRGIHPAVAEALAGFDARSSVESVVARSGYSHRRFVALFREAVGLSPKRYSRVLRFRAALARLAGRPTAAWADLALAAGYSDQPHFNRDFREFAGVTPGEYRSLAPLSAHHVPIRSKEAD